MEKTPVDESDTPVYGLLDQLFSSAEARERVRLRPEIFRINRKILLMANTEVPAHPDSSVRAVLTKLATAGVSVFLQASGRISSPSGSVALSPLGVLYSRPARRWEMENEEARSPRKARAITHNKILSM